MLNIAATLFNVILVHTRLYTGSLSHSMCFWLIPFLLQVRVGTLVVEFMHIMQYV